MKSKLLILACLLWGSLSYGKPPIASAPDSAKAPDSAQIYLSGNDRISGVIEDMSADLISIRSPFSPTPWRVKRSSVQSIRFDRPRQKESTFFDRIYVRNQDQEVLPAIIHSVEADKVVADTYFSKGMSLPRSAVSSIQFRTISSEPLLEEPLMSEGIWMDGQPTENHHLFSTAFKRANQNAKNSHAVVLPPMPWTKNLRCDLRAFELLLDFSLAQPAEDKNSQGVTMVIQGKVPATNGHPAEDLTLMMRLDQGTWYLSTKSDSTEQQLLDMPVRSPLTEPQSVAIRVSKVDSELLLEMSLNGEKSKSVSLGIPMIASASFSINPHVPAFAVKRLQINKQWTSYDRDQPPPSATFDTVDTTDDEWIPGNLLSFNAKQGRAVVVTKDNKQLAIPTEFLSSLYFKVPTQASASDDAGAVTRVTLTDSSRLFGSSPSIKRGKLSMHHALFGQVSIPLHQVQRIDFFNQRPPHRSEP